jgi:hypothetical protein
VVTECSLLVRVFVTVSYRRDSVCRDVWYELPEEVVRGCRALGIMPQVPRTEVEIPGLEADLRGLTAEISSLHNMLVNRAAAQKRPRRRLQRPNTTTPQRGKSIEDESARDEHGSAAADDDSATSAAVDVHKQHRRKRKSPIIAEESTAAVERANDDDEEHSVADEDVDADPDTNTGVMRAGETKYLGAEFDECDELEMERERAPLPTYRVAKVSPKDRYNLQELQTHWTSLSNLVTADEQKRNEPQHISVRERTYARTHSVNTLAFLVDSASEESISRSASTD